MLKSKAEQEQKLTYSFSLFYKILYILFSSALSLSLYYLKQHV
jgi:hypothetical protein